MRKEVISALLGGGDFSSGGGDLSLGGREQSEFGQRKKKERGYISQ